MESSTVTTCDAGVEVLTQNAKQLLSSINWSFTSPFVVGRSGVDLFDCRKYHWYPATFIPEIPHTLIELLTAPGAVVYDPFSGIGTTVLQCLALGRAYFGTEVCSVAVEFVQNLLALLGSDSELTDTSRGIIERVSSYDPDIEYEPPAEFQPQAELLRPWFAPVSFRQLMFLAACEREAYSRTERAAIAIAISSTLKAVCAQEKGWGCIADNMRPRPEQRAVERDVLARFRRNLGVLLRDLQAFKKALPGHAQCLLRESDVSSRVANDDVRTTRLVDDSSVDLVVTSPPYPSMTDYCTSQRLSYYWSGKTPDGDLMREIGARRRRFSRDAIAEYTSAMRDACSVIGRKVKPGGRACFVLPTFDSHRENDVVRRRAIQDYMNTLFDSGFILEQELVRMLPTLRRHHNQKWTSLEREGIFVYRRIG